MSVRMPARSVVLGAAGHSPRLRHRGRTAAADRRLRHQGQHAAGRADPDGGRRGPGSLRRGLPAVRPSAGPPAPPGRRTVSGDPGLGVAVADRRVVAVGEDARVRAALRSALHDGRFGELREGCGCGRTTSSRTCRSRPTAGAGTAPRDPDPGELAARLWDLPVWSATGRGLLREMDAAPTSPPGSWWPRRWSATCSPTRCCRPNCCPPTGPPTGCEPPTPSSPR